MTKYCDKEKKETEVLIIKDFLKKHIPNMYKVASNLNFILRYYKYFKTLKDLYCFTSPSSIGNKRIVFNSVRPYFEGILFFENALAIKLREFGSKINILIDDGILRHHESVQYQDFFKISDVVFRTKIASNFLGRIPLYKKYSEFISRSELKKISLIANSLIKKGKYFYKNINLKPYIDSSVIRYFKSAIGFSEKEREYNKIFKICTENAVISILVALKVEELLHPDIIITSHGIYSTWGPFYEYFKQKEGKKVISYDFGGYKNNGVIFSKRGLVANRCDDGFFNIYKDKIDITIAEKSIKDIFDKRFKGKSTDLILYGNFTEDNNLLKEIKDIAYRRRIFALFPNVLWDNSLSTSIDNIFNSPVEWLVDTIKFFEKEEDKLLLIREHPAGASFMKSRIGIREIVKNEFGKDVRDIKNLIFIPSNNLIKSYSLFPIIKAGIVYNGTIGLEMMYKKIPVLIAGKAPYSYKEFTVDFKNKKEYFQAFNKVGDILEYQEKNREVLSKFLFYYFVLNEIPLSFYDENKWCHPKLNVVPELILGDRNLKYIAETILDKKDFFQEWFWNEG